MPPIASTAILVALVLNFLSVIICLCNRVATHPETAASDFIAIVFLSVLFPAVLMWLNAHVIKFTGGEPIAVTGWTVTLVILALAMLAYRFYHMFGKLRMFVKNYYTVCHR